MKTDGPACSVRRGEASKYMAQVKDRFATEPERYTRFIEIITSIYGSGSPDRSYEERLTLIRNKMKDDIFKGHEDLMEGFEAFIEPEGDGANVEKAVTMEEKP